MLGASAAAAAVAAGYQTMAPTGQWYGPTFTGLPPGSRELALTFDDGPNDRHTLELLEVLAQHGVRATFFMIGKFAKQQPKVVREVVAAGHAVGNHTFSHSNLIFVSRSQTETEIRECQCILQDSTGQPPALFRPPFGARRSLSLRVARGHKLTPVMWNVSGRDWKGKPASYIVSNVLRGVGGGNVILLHDGSHAHLGADRSQTVIATDTLIRRCSSEGYKFVTIPQMLALQ